MIKLDFEESVVLRNKMLEDEHFLTLCDDVSGKITSCLGNGLKLLVAGNGGSAADAQHFVAEVVGRYKKERKGYPAIALTTDTSILTAVGNDYSFDAIFSRQVEALGKEGDVFVGISTSGNSKNIIEAVKEAKRQKLTTVCLLGNDGGVVKEMCDYALVVPSDNTPRIQEVHITLIHSICEKIDQQLT